MVYYQPQSSRNTCANCSDIHLEHEVEEHLPGAYHCPKCGILLASIPWEHRLEHKHSKDKHSYLPLLLLIPIFLFKDELESLHPLLFLIPLVVALIPLFTNSKNTHPIAEILSRSELDKILQEQEDARVEDRKIAANIQAYKEEERLSRLKKAWWQFWK